MNYTVSFLATKADCQALIMLAQAEISDQEYRKSTLNRQYEAAFLSGQGIAADLAAVGAELDALQTVLTSLPPGKTRDEIEDRITKATYKKYQLKQRQEKSGNQFLLNKEYDLAVADKAIGEADDFILQLQARMAVLP